MRFSGEGTTAEDLVNTASEEELLKIFRTYGEDPFAEKVAQRLVRRRCVSPLRSSFDLRTIVEETVPPHLAAKTLSRIFQALRIAVNDELGELQSLLACSDKLLNPGGRIVVIAYHSLEDRLVKTAFKEKSKPQHIKPEINSDYNIATTVPTLRILTTKPILPSDSELAANPRARSAKMRVAERV